MQLHVGSWDLVLRSCCVDKAMTWSSDRRRYFLEDYCLKILFFKIFFGRSSAWSKYKQILVVCMTSSSTKFTLKQQSLNSANSLFVLGLLQGKARIARSESVTHWGGLPCHYWGNSLCHICLEWPETGYQQRSPHRYTQIQPSKRPALNWMWMAT